MALQASGLITLDDLHVEAGGTSGTLCSLNDEDIRNIIGVSAGGSQNIGSTDYRYNAVYANNVFTGDFHMKNERGDWTLFEESDHIRIRNNKTCQTFKLGMSLIEE